MAKVGNRDDRPSSYDEFDDIVRALAALREREDGDPLAARVLEAGPDPAAPALPRATIEPLRRSLPDDLAPQAPEAAEAPPRPPLRFPPRPRPAEARDDAGPPAGIARSGREAEAADPRRRKPLAAAALGICACAVALASLGAHVFVGPGDGYRLAEAHTSPPADTTGPTLTSSMLLQASQRRSATAAAVSGDPAAIPPPGVMAGWERAAVERMVDGDPHPPAPGRAPQGAAPRAQQRVAALAPDEALQSLTSIGPRVAPVFAPAEPARTDPAAVPPRPAAPGAAARPEPAAAATAPPRPRFSAEATGELIARARSMIDTTADIAGARLLLERATDMGDPAAAFALAEVFDPHVLGRMRVLGIRADPARARRHYQQALDGGVEAARPRLTALGN